MKCEQDEFEKLFNFDIALSKKLLNKQIYSLNKPGSSL